ncbi:hypothetical protein J1614_003950 [Plenodomus biglobosus]|nr:hypothetical protein J1614_003950 [Plenodomus biglobosus]
MRCRRIDWESVVLKAKANTENYFDELWLDCMNRSKPKHKNFDDEYWMQNRNVDGRWDSKCRIKHSQASWMKAFHPSSDEEEV